jgi:pimeloyl-ACP methyl ester carboxylesterase
MAALESLEFQGCRLAYRVDGAGPPLVMIQGVGAQGTSPNPQIERLAPHYACLSFDNRGIGASQPVGFKLTSTQMAHDTLALMNRLDWPSAHIVGHSFGSIVALEVALLNKIRVRSLSLLCAFARGEDAIDLSVRLIWIIVRLRHAPPKIRRQAFLELVLPPGHPELHSEKMAARISAIVGHDVADMPRITSQQVKAMRASDVTPRLHELAGIPTLVINGGKDMIARPALGRALAAGIPGARYVEIPDAGHSLPIIDPERCAGFVLEHLAEVTRCESQGC